MRNRLLPFHYGGSVKMHPRSAEFMQTPLLDKLRWMRVAGDTIFALGAVGLAWFVLGLKTGWSYAGKEEALGAAVSKPAVD